MYNITRTNRDLYYCIFYDFILFPVNIYYFIVLSSCLFLVFYYHSYLHLTRIPIGNCLTLCKYLLATVIFIDYQ